MAKDFKGRKVGITITITVMTTHLKQSSATTEETITARNNVKEGYNVDT